MIKFSNPHYIHPPGSNKQIVSHPVTENAAVDIAIFQEHRYAFFYWMLWTREKKTASPPCLITLDWHQDLCFPSNEEKKLLKKLDQNDDGAVAVFSWASLNNNNDGHILSAAYLNIIGNIYVHCRQATSESDWKDEELIDFKGNKHIIKKFRTYDELERLMPFTNEERVYFDIDLDFFTFNNPLNGKGNKFSYMKKEEMMELLSIDRILIKWIFERLCGFTIATEPEHCGGLLKSNKLLDIINKIYFEPSIFTPDCEWKHKNDGSELV